MGVTKYITLICDELDAIISENVHELKHAKNFKVRPDIVYDKFYMDREEGIYRPDHYDLSISLEQCEELDHPLNHVYFNVMKHVGNKLKEFDFFDDSEFVTGGYLNWWILPQYSPDKL